VSGGRGTGEIREGKVDGEAVAGESEDGETGSGDRMGWSFVGSAKDRSVGDRIRMCGQGDAKGEDKGPDKKDAFEYGSSPMTRIGVRVVKRNSMAKRCGLTRDLSGRR
jgi:hypothetical protein